MIDGTKRVMTISIDKTGEVSNIKGLLYKRMMVLMRMSIIGLSVGGPSVEKCRVLYMIRQFQ